ncbi:hypothetical protein [uncultured Dubosiella sp.]|uniref:hypothetical protein n=1 Tax=uncultured Dubosiella sp. TaxID=1937011 RepID=UPI0025B2E214|nr:hypothetical protein [uncultured Dubosiella sp.]
MYVMDRLFVLNETASGTTDGRIARALLLRPPRTARKFREETGVSKATLHRFCAKGGFSSFQALVEVLDEERDFAPFWLEQEPMAYEMPDVDELVEAIRSAKTVVFNGSFEEIHLLQRTFHVLTLLGKTIEVLSDWDLEAAYEKLDRLTEADVYLHLDANLRLDLFQEYVVNRPYLPAYEKIAAARGKKFYASRQISHAGNRFNQIGLIIAHRRHIRPYLLAWDETLANTLWKERGTT